MTIFINGSELDFKLEKEKTLLEVLNSLESWIDNQGHQLEEIDVDGAPLVADNMDDWKDNPIGELGRIDLTTISKVEARIGYLQALYQFFLLLQRSLEENNDALLGQIASTYPDIRVKLSHLFPAPESQSQHTFTERLDEFLTGSGIFTTGKVPENPETLIELVSKLNLIISELIREITNPLTELLTTAHLLNNLISEMEEISVLLQTGKDKEAMESIIRFTELSQKLIRIYPNLMHHGIVDVTKEKIQEKPFHEFYREFNSTLTELTNAFQANDTVLIGDLLEYEIAPRLEELTHFLENIKGKEK